MGDQDESKPFMAKQGEKMVISPYSLFSSDNPGDLITCSVKGDNYNEWSMEMKNALRAKKKTGS